MNKKFFTIGMTVLLGVSLFFFGCPSEVDDDTSGANDDPQTPIKPPGPSEVDVTGYSLMDGTCADVKLVSSTKDQDGKVTLKLKGKVKSDYVLKGKGNSNDYEMGDSFQPEPGYWVGTNEKPAEGIYAPVYVKGLFDWTESGNKVLAIKHTNQALRIYQNNPTDEFLATSPTGPTINKVNNQKTLWMPTSPSTDAPVRWKLYSAIPKDDTLGILIWNGGPSATPYSPKEATLVIQEYDGYEGTDGQATTSKPKTGGYAKTVVINYSDVTFEEPSVKVAASGATADSIKTALDTANTSVVVLTADTATTVTLSATLTVTAGKTLRVGANVTLVTTGTDNAISLDGEIVVENGGALKLSDGAKGNFTGTVTAKSDASVYDFKSGGGSLWTSGNTGKFVYEAGSKGYIGGEADTNVRIGSSTDTSAKYQLESGAKFTLRADKYTLEGSASGDPWGVSEGMTFEILAGGVYTVDDGKTFVLIGPSENSEVQGGKLIGAGKVVVGATELSGGTGGWQAVGNASVSIHRDSAVAASIWGSQTLRGGTGATITQLTGSGNTLNIGATDDNANANALKLDLGTGASLILKSGENPGKVVIPKTTSHITLGASGTTGSAIGGVASITIGGSTVTSTGFAAADYQVAGGKLVKIGGTTAGSISASTVADSDVTINADAAVTGSAGGGS